MGLSVFGLGMSAIMKLTHNPQAVEGFTKMFGFQESALTPIGVVELLVVSLYAIPKTRVLGAILCTSYLGGAVATHVRVGDAFIAPMVLGVLVWGGVFLQDARVRKLLPLVARKSLSPL